MRIADCGFSNGGREGIAECGVRSAEMWEERIRRALLSLFFVSLCLPVAIQQTALGLSLAFLAYVGWRNRGLPSTPLDRPLLLCLTALLLSTLFSPDVLNSLLGYRKLWLVGAF